MTRHKDVEHFYDSVYYKEQKNSNIPWHMRKVAARLNLESQDSVLDIACGTGDWLKLLQQSYKVEVSGIDISKSAARLAQENIPNADIRHGIAEQLPFDSKQFDAITCMGSLEHFLDQPAALKEMLRVAKPNARLLILVPNSGFLTRRLGLYKGTNQIAINETVRSIEEWSRMLNEAGLEITAVWKDLHPLSLGWIAHGAFWHWPIRALQAIALCIWPVSWQYQVYFLCKSSK